MKIYLHEGLIISTVVQYFNEILLPQVCLITCSEILCFLFVGENTTAHGTESVFQLLKNKNYQHINRSEGFQRQS